MSCVCRISILNESELHRLTATEQTNALMKSTNERKLYFPDGNAELPGDISIVYSIRPIQTNAYLSTHVKGKHRAEPLSLFGS